MLAFPSMMKDTLIDELLSYYPFDFAQIMLNYMDVVHEPGMVGYEKLTKANVPVIIMVVAARRFISEYTRFYR